LPLSPGTDSEGNHNQPGVYTKSAHSPSAYHRFFAGCLNDNQWARFSPRDILGEFQPSESSSGEARQEQRKGILSVGIALGQQMKNKMYERVVTKKESISSSLHQGGHAQVEQMDPQQEIEEPFYADDVRDCDYVIHPNGTIVFWKDNQALREFHTKHVLHEKLLKEILEVYPAMPFASGTSILA
jgi:hypothetical protein